MNGSSGRRYAILAEGRLPEAKTAHGVLRYGRDEVVAVIDSTLAGQTVSGAMPGLLTDPGRDAPIVASLEEALAHGVTREILNLVRASKLFHAGPKAARPAPPRRTRAGPPSSTARRSRKPRSATSSRTTARRCSRGCARSTTSPTRSKVLHSVERFFNVALVQKKSK